MGTLSAFQILREACDQLGYQCQDVALNGGTSLKVSNGQKFFYSGSGQDYAVYPLNLFTLQKLLSSKWITKTLIQDLGEAVIPGHIFRCKQQGEKNLPLLSHACERLADSFFPIVWKPDKGEQGNGVRFIRNKQQLQHQIDTFLPDKPNQHIIIDQYIDEPEYRLFYALGKVYYVYKRTQHRIVGDGQTALALLIDEKKLKDPERTKAQTYQFLDVRANWIPAQGQVVKLIGPSNLSQDGEMEDYSASPPPNLQQWAQNICQALSLDICGIDVFIQNYGKDTMQTKIIELNFNPGLLGVYQSGKKEMAYQIWRDILKHYFDGSC